MEIKAENIQPLKNFVLIKAIEKPAETAAGFVMPEETYSPTPVIGTIFAKGPDSKFNIGEVVFFRRFSVDELKFNSNDGKPEMVSLISDDEIVGTLNQNA